MKRVRTAFIFASLAGFGFGVANGCGTDPVSPHVKKAGTGGSVSTTGGSAGTNGETAGTPVVGSGGTDGTGTTGAGGVTAGTGGSSGANGMAGGSSGSDMTGAGGANGGAAGSEMGGAGGSNGGSSGAGGTSGAGGDAAGAGGSTPPTGCTNATVVDAAGSTTKCPAMNTWMATAMPTPAHNYLGIADNKLQPQYAIDGSTGTRYSSGATAAGGEWFKVDLGVSTQITGIVLDNTIDINDVPYGYKVEVSTDGNAWTQVATCNAIASTTETVNFAAKPGRYVRVTQTAVGIHWWSIDELGVLCK